MSEAPQVPGSQPKLLDRVRSAIRVRHYSRRTEVAYVTWNSPQNQALAALLFLYERVLQMPIGQVKHVVRPRYNQVPRNLIGSRMESVHVHLANRS